MKKILLFLLVNTIVLAGCNKKNTESCDDGIKNQDETGIDCGGICTPCICPDTVIDIDGNIYSTISIGNQCWMRENLRTTRYNDGTVIREVEDSLAWGNISLIQSEEPAWCNYNADITNDTIYGKLYNWYVVINSRQVCPAGWHVPTDADFMQLTNYLGGDSVAGGKMKALNFWYNPNIADNSSGFSALPGGFREPVGEFISIGYVGDFWSSSKINGYMSLCRSLENDAPHAHRLVDNSKNCGFSIRCVKD